MNIAIFASAFWPRVGGVEEVVRQLAHEFQERGDSPLVVTNRWPKSLPETEDYEGLPVRRYNFRVPDHTWRQMGGALLFGPATLRRLCREVARHGAQLIHVQCVSSNAYYAIRVIRALRVPLVVTLQGELGMDAGGLFQRSAFARALMRDALDRADLITACSQQTLTEAEQFYGAPFGDRGRVIYNGIRLDEFHGAAPFDHPRPYILGLGRHVRQKGFDLLLRAFAEVAPAQRSGHDLLIAGDGPERTSLERLAVDLGIGEVVRFLGSVDHSQAIRLFKGCSFFVLPSRHEPLGIVNLEAMAANKGVIASRVGGVPEIVVDGEQGILVPGEDVQALSSAMGRMMGDPALRQRFGAAAGDHVRQFDWAAIAGQYVQVYEQACHLQHQALSWSSRWSLGKARP